MKRLLAFNLLAFLVSHFISFPIGNVQDEARPAWQVVGVEIAVKVLQTERALDATAILTFRNVGRAAGSSITLRINSRAKINSINANGTSATFRVRPDPRPTIQRLDITVPSAVAANSSVNLSIDYRLPVESNSGLEAISPVGSQFLPLSFWYPLFSSPYTIRGIDTAPFKLKIEGANVISSGLEKPQGGSATIYEQPLNGQPFFVQGEWDRNEGSGEGKGIIAFLPKGAPADEKKQADAMISVAASARSFYATLLGPAPESPVRLVAVRRGAGFNDSGAVLIDWGAFRRGKLDASTAMLIAESIARLWIGGQTPVRGEAGGVLHDGLARYLAVLFLQKQFGPATAESELLRERVAYSAIAKRDAPLSRTTPLDDTYFGSVPNKGAMVWRLVERRLGRDSFMSTLRSLLQAGSTDQNGISLASVRTKLAEIGGDALKKLLDQELDQPTDMDLMVGLPQQRGNQWVAALRNLGSIDASITIVATTDRGEQLKVEGTIPAQNFGEAVFNTTTKPVRVEIDPDKLYPQIDYSNDSVPHSREVNEAMAEASRLFGAQDYVRAEAAAREIVTAAPRMQEARILLARVLLGANKVDEAEKLFRAALDEALPTPVSLAWANVGLGEIALKKGQPAEAARRFNDAVRADAEYGASLAARAGRIQAESSTAGSTPPVDEAIRAFISQLDHAIISGRQTELAPHVVPGEMVRFLNGIVGTQPELWQTRVLRTEQLENDWVAADVNIKARQLGKDASGTAVLILVRVNGAWRLANIELFEVR